MDEKLRILLCEDDENLGMEVVVGAHDLDPGGVRVLNQLG